MSPSDQHSSRTHPDPSSFAQGSPLSIDPSALAALQRRFTARVQNLWSQLASGQGPVVEDRRFASIHWQSDSQAQWNAAWYLLQAEFMTELAALVRTDERSAERIRFATRQFIDAASPANFLATNPDARAALFDSGGSSLGQGIANLLADIGQGSISQTDRSAFALGRNVAVTPGDVVFENELVQLIQYRSATPKVHARPLLIVPPCINKFYILDLQPENSFVAHAVAQGHTVFLVSWRNAGPAQAHLDWDDYLQLGIVEAIEVARAISASDQLNLLGFCVGGTLLAAALAALAARGEHPASSLTLLTTLLDFEDSGQLGMFIDEQQVAWREFSIGRGGLLDGRELAATFSFLRPNELVWNYVVDNYLRGRKPPAFDLLFWNGDSTNLPGPMFCWYLRHTYLQNELSTPGRLRCLGEAIDLSRIDCPSYVVACREDHIVPWKAAYRSARCLGGEQRFVLGASGHIAGVVNPPARGRRSHWVASDPMPDDQAPAAASSAARAPAPDADAWLAQSVEQQGSWWPDWAAWLAGHAGVTRSSPRACGSSKYAVIEPAPGRYVRQRAEDALRGRPESISTEEHTR